MMKHRGMAAPEGLIHQKIGSVLRLEAVVMGAAAAFGGNPGDDLVGIGDITGFAMNAVGGIDFQTRAGTLRAGFHLVNRRRAEILARVAVFHRTALVTDIEVGDLQVARLIFVVMGARMKDVRNFIEGQPAVGFDLGD